MVERDHSLWPAGGASPPGADSIADELASRIEAVPPAPGDAMDWASLAARYDREASALGGRPAAAELLFEAGRIYEERLVDPATALAFYRRALAADPALQPNLRAISRLAGDRENGELAPGGADAAEEAVAEAALRGDRASLAHAYERCARAVTDDRLAAHYLEAAAAVAAEGLGDTVRAGELALEAFARFPADPIVRGTARLHAEHRGRLELLSEILRAEASDARGPAATWALLELARVEERLGRSDAAVEALERGRGSTEASEDVRVLAELARLRERRGEWQAASEALEALAAAHLARAEEGHRLEAIAAKLRRMEIEEARLGRIEEALRCARDVVAVDPGRRDALAAMGRLCARTGDWEGLFAAFQAEAAAAYDPLERAQRAFKAAQVLEERLARTAEAADGYRAALQADPGLLAARTALERLLEREGRWAELCTLLEEELAESAPAAEQVATLFRLARLQDERLDDLVGAAARYRRILELEPENRVALRSLAVALERSGRLEELAVVLAREAGGATDPRRRVALLQRRAEVLEELGGDADRALAAWEELRAAAPTHLPALRALGRLHAAAERWEPLASMFRAEADAAAEPSQAADLLLRTGELLERLERPDDAIAAYREALTLAPAHLPALLALSRLYRARGEHEGLAEALGALAAARVAPAERAAALAELGRLCEEHLRDPRRALESHEEALRTVPGFVPSLRAAERLAIDLGCHDVLATLRRAALADAGAEDRAERLFRLAWLEAERMDDTAAAARAAEALAETAPDSPGLQLLQLRLARAREALTAAGGETAAARAPEADLAPERPEAPAAPALEAAGRELAGAEPARAVGEQAELARLCEARYAAAGDAASRAAWAVQSGEAWERAGDPDRALGALQAALGASPGHLPALRAARTLFANRRDWGAVRATLQAEGEALQDRDEAAAAWREAGTIAEQWFGDVEGAVQDYRRALERDPDDAVALTRVEALLAARGVAQLAEVHAARARAEADPGRAASAWLAAARASLGASEGGREAALGHLDRALTLRPEFPQALELRARVHGVTGDAAAALADIERCLSLGGEPAARLPLHLAAAGLCHETLGEPDAALRHVEAALGIAPESGEALARLARLHREGGRLPSAVDALRRLVGISGLPREAQLEHGFALAELEAALGALEPALAACRHVLDLEPGHPGALRLQVELERRRGDPAEVAVALEAASSSARDPAFRSDAHLQAARLHAGPLRNRQRALDHLRAALELTPEREEVRALLAELAEEGAPSLALEQHRRLIDRDPLRIESWVGLYRLLDRTRAYDGAFVAATVIRWLGAAPPGPGAERLLLEADRQTLGPPPPLGPADLELLRAPGDRGPLAEVIAAAGDALAGVLLDPRETRGAPVREDHPFRKVLADLARCLGLGDYDLFAAPLGRLTVEPGDPAAVLVGADLAHRSTLREQRFLLGRAAARLKTRSALAEAFPDSFADGVGAAVRQVVPHHRGVGSPDEELVRRVGAAMSRKVRRALEQPARALAHQRPAPDLGAWRAAAAATADRAGLVLCGDVPTALDLLLREGAGRVSPAPEGRVTALRTRPDALALLAFAASEAHLVLRQRVRVAIA
jgi:tetratricopeptide (TPR) repeat protein